MRRGMGWVLALLLLSMTLGARAGGLRHQVTGDVSQMEASQAQSQAKARGSQAQIGTDIYLFVDPDTASDITFRVIDDEGRTVPGAQIYISYKRATELYGTSGSNGKCGMYLFRNERYGYKVTKSGYLASTGTFQATAATKTVTAVLRKLHTLSVYVIRDGQPVGGIWVQADGQRSRTDRAGRAQAQLPNGAAQVVVTLEDGRKISVPVLMDGDTAVVVDITAGDGLLDDGQGLYQDRLLVVDAGRACRDYVLTEHRYDASDITRLPGEGEEAYQARVARYLAAHPNMVIVEAQPDEDGTWSERSMVPSGALLKRFQAQGHALIRYICGPIGVTVDLNELTGGELAKALHLLGRGEAVTDEAMRALNDMDMNAALLETARFELRIAPIARQALREMMAGGLGREAQEQADEIMLLSPGHFQAVMRQREAEGLITPEESQALSRALLDGRLTPGEMNDLRADYAAGRLSDEALDALIDGALAGEMRRVQWLVSVAGAEADVTGYLPSMRVHWDGEALIRGGYSEAELARLAMISVAGGRSAMYALTLENDKLDPADEFYDVLMAKRMRKVTVHVRREALHLGGQTVMQDRADIETGTAALPTQDARRLTAYAHDSGVYGLVRADGASGG